MAVGPIRSFGRTRSRTLKPNQAALLAEHLPQVEISPGPIDPSSLAPGFDETWLEVGFGGGEHLAAQAVVHPHVLLLGAEPYVNGVASALRHLKGDGITNVRLWPDDGRTVMEALPDASLTRIFVLFPDPWPKVRHHKRRLIDAAFVLTAARLLRPGGLARFATDWEDYADQALAVFTRSQAFVWTARRADDWRLAPPDHVTTRYERKRLGDIAPVWFEFRRVCDATDAPG
jgi:tRNA (guanine-N7-)-methyltransferase